MSFFEAGMIICFGVSWPVAVWKTLRTKQVEGKSMVFIALVALGYGFGVIHKAIYNFDWLIFLYGFNFLIVLTELGLCVIYGSRPKCELTNSNAKADTLFIDGRSTALTIQRQLPEPAPIHDDTAKSRTTHELAENRIVMHRPSTPKRRAGNLKSKNHQQQNLWPGGASSSYH